MQSHSYTYEHCLKTSERVSWRLDDIIGAERRLDFTRPFLPESLARVEALGFLAPGERLALNHIRGLGYLCMFGLVEEFILPFVLDHARPRLPEDSFRTRAYLQFAAEEAKHIQLFRRFRAEFEDGFGTSCQVIGPPQEVARQVLSHHPLAVALTVLHIEWMTQRHYLASVKDDGQLDSQFKSLLKHHWIEEAQHAKLDTLMVEALAETCDEGEIHDAFEGYLAIGGLLDNGLRQQVAFDLEALERATGRMLSDAESEVFVAAQHQAQRWTFLGSGMTHPDFHRTLQGLHSGLAARLESIAPAFC